MSLTKQQEKFIDEYIQTFNIEMSAIRAGYPRDEALSIGIEMLSSDVIQEYLKKRTEQFEQIARNNFVTKERLYLTMMLSYEKAFQKGDIKTALDILERMAKWNGVNPDVAMVEPAKLIVKGVDLDKV